jgi:hypothetical protein
MDHPIGTRARHVWIFDADGTSRLITGGAPFHHPPRLS